MFYQRRGRVRARDLAIGTGLGVLAGYFLDPDRGRGRRAETADRAAGVMRRAGRRVGRGVRYLQATAAGTNERLRRSGSRPEEWINDETLAHKVESELFRDPSIPKGSINLNAEHGTVVLRGVVESQDRIEQIMVTTMAIEGVRAVRSLLRLRPSPKVTPDEVARDQVSHDRPGLLPAEQTERIEVEAAGAR
jgi:hypothetical protein